MASAFRETVMELNGRCQQGGSASEGYGEESISISNEIIIFHYLLNVYMIYNDNLYFCSNFGNMWSLFLPFPACV